MNKSIKELILESNKVIIKECKNVPCEECQFDKFIGDNNERSLCCIVADLAEKYLGERN